MQVKNFAKSTIPDPVSNLQVKVTDFEFLCSFYNVCFCEAFDRIDVWHGDKNWSQIICGIIPNPVHDLGHRLRILI